MSKSHRLSPRTRGRRERCTICHKVWVIRPRHIGNGIRIADWATSVCNKCFWKIMDETPLW